MAAAPWGEVLRVLSSLAVLAAVLLVRSPTRAQETSEAAPSAVPAVTREEAIARARAAQPRVRATAADEAILRARATVPSSRWLPRLGATLQVVLGSANNSPSNWQSTGGVVATPRISGTAYLQDPSDVVWTPYLTTFVGVGLDQEVFDFGRIDAAQRAADASLDAAHADTEVVTLDVEARAIEAYAAVQAARELLRSAEAGRDRAAAIVASTRAWAEQGLRAAIEIARAEAQLARYAVAVEHARAAQHLARAQLAAAIAADTVEVDAAEAAEPSPLPTLGSALDSIDTTPALRAASARARAATARLDVAETALLPDLRLVATVMGSAGGAPTGTHTSPAFGAGAVPFVPNYFAGLILRWQFFDAESMASRDVARAEADAARAHADAIREDARLAIEVAWYTASGAEASLEALTAARDAAVASYAQVEAQYAAGLASAVEMADAENLRTSAEVELAVGRFALDQARAELDRAMSRGASERETP